MRIAGFVGIGVGLVGFGVAGAFAAKAGSKHSDADTLYNDTYKCNIPGNCVKDRQAQIQGLDDQANAAKKTANLGVVIGAVGLVGGATLLILSSGKGGGKEKASAPPATTVTPWIGLSSAGLSGTF